MKSYLINRLGSLKRLGDAIETFLDKKQSDYYTALENQGSKTKSAYKTTEMTMLVALDISWKALDLIWAQYSAAEAQFLQGKEMPRDCMGLFRKQWGLPCCHELWERLHSRERLSLENVSVHWHLRRETPLSEDTRRAQTLFDSLPVYRTIQQREEQKARIQRHGNWPIYKSLATETPPPPQASQDNSTRREPSHWEEGRRQKRGREPTQASPPAAPRRKRTTKKQKENAELQQRYVDAIEVAKELRDQLRASQAVPQAPSQITPPPPTPALIRVDMRPRISSSSAPLPPVASQQHYAPLVHPPPSGQPPMGQSHPQQHVSQYCNQPYIAPGQLRQVLPSYGNIYSIQVL